MKGHSMLMALRWCLLSAVVLVIMSEKKNLFTSALPDGFIAETVADVKGVTGKFAPHPSANSAKPQILMIVSKTGQVHLVENPDESSETKIILDLAGQVCTNGERGLQSITVHPNFTENRYVYLFYAKYIEGCPEGKEEGTWNVIERFVMDPETYELDNDSRKEIWRTSPLHLLVHNGGAMDFGIDNKLYITTGDSGRKTSAQQLDNSLGSIIRLNDDGSVPNDNPFTVQNGYNSSYRCADTGGLVPSNVKDDENAICAEVFGYGFRNPFRIEMDKTEIEKVKFSISDVGGAYWEDISWGGSDYEGKNYGWPDWEGPCRQNSISDCPIADEKFVVEPFHYYQHRSIREGGAAAGSAIVPPNLWPPQYKFLFIDFIFLEIYNLIEDPENECRSCLPPVSGYRNESFYQSIQKKDEHVNNARMLDMFFGPYKNTTALYIVRFGAHDSVIRIRYTGILNAPPLANFTVPDQIYGLGDDVQFNSSVSSDPEDDALNFVWDFGDGKMSNDTNPVHQFEHLGEYVVTLKVSDIYDQMQQKSHIVIVGDRPNVIIVSPTIGDVFYVGEMLQLQGEAYDNTGARLNDTQLTWEVRKHHADHFHPFMDLTNGNNLTLYPAPQPEDIFATTNSYLRIILIATDKDGLTTEVDRIVQPALVTVDVESNPQGLTIGVDDYPVTTSEVMTSWKEHDLRLKVEDQNAYIFIGWSDGISDRERTVRLSGGINLIQANFCGDIGRRCLNGYECCSEYCVVNECVSETPEPPAPPSQIFSAQPSTMQSSAPSPQVFGDLPQTMQLDSSNTTSVSSLLNWNIFKDSLSKVLVGLFSSIILILLAFFIGLKQRQKGKNCRSSSCIPVEDKGRMKDGENYSINSSDPNNATMTSDNRDDSDRSASMEADCIEASDACSMEVDNDEEKGARVINVKRI